MGCLILPIFVTLAFVRVHGLPERGRIFYPGEIYQGMTYLGKATTGRNGQMQTESIYFTSPSLLNRTTANVACIQLLGFDASLVSFETPEEVDLVYDLLNQSNSPIQSFWTAGKYEVERQFWSWENGDEVSAQIWADAEPSEELKSSKLLMTRDRVTLKASSKGEDDSYNSICELIWGSSSEPIPCYNTNDLVIIVDSSGSITEPLYGFAISFARQLAAAWTGWPNTQLGFMIYGNSPHVRRPLKPVGNEELEILRIINESPYLNEGTRSDLALQIAFNEVFANNRSDDPVPQNVVFLTDGQTSPSEYKPVTYANAKTLHDHVVRTFSVGIGTEANLDLEELNAIASHPSYVFTIKDFPSLEQVLKPVSNLACDAS